jgi:hypothetical protein
VGKPESRAEAALEELCVRLGYCLPEDEAQSVLERRSYDLDDFADAVFLTDGLDPELIDRRARAEVVGVISDWLFDDSGSGAKSGLPRFPLGA